MELRQFRHFVAVAEELHFARAAERLGITQPALSQQIKALEERLGARLFTRAKRRVELTQAGAVLLTEARSVLDRAERAVALVRRAGRGESGRVEIGYVGAAMVQPTLPRVIRSFRELRPGVELNFRLFAMMDQLDAVRDHELDLAVLRRPIGSLPEGIEAHPIVSEPLVVGVPDGHRAAGGDSVRFADLADEDFIAFADPPGVGLGQVLEDLARETGFRPRVTQRVAEQSAMLGMIAAGIGVGLMANAVRFLRMPGVRFLDISDTAIVSEVVVVHRRNETAPAVRAFLDVARKAFRDRPGTDDLARSFLPGDDDPGGHADATP